MTKKTISSGDVVRVEGHPFHVVSVNSKFTAPDGYETWHFTGKALEVPENRSILGTTYAYGNYSWRPAR